MNKKFLSKCLISLGLLLFFTFLPQIMPTPVSIAQASEIEKEKNNEQKLNYRSITLVNGRTFPLELKVSNLEKDDKVSYRSADPEIASVNEDGEITANKVGKTTITATVRRGFNSTSLTCEVTIGPPAFSVKLTRSMLILGLDQSFQLEAVMKPANTVERTKFSSNDPSVASISSGGRVTGRKPGMTYVFAEIDATNQNGKRKFSSCSVIISNEEDVSLLNDYFSLHAELSLLSEAELSNALFDFFNPIETVSDTSNSSTTSTENTAKANTPSDNSTTRIADTNGGSSDSTNTNSNSGLSLVESLDKHLNSRFDLAQLRERYEERFQVKTEIQLSSLYSNIIRR